MLSGKNRTLLIAALAAFVWGICPVTGFAECSAPRCDLAADGAYTNVVIGTLVHVGTDAELKHVFHWARAHDYWQSLPDSFSPYLHDVKLVTISPSDQRAPMKVFMARSEYEAAPLVVGDLVRYKPHDGTREAPAEPMAKRLFHGLTGCVATLCSQADASCQSRYRRGVFTPGGRQVNRKTGNLLADGIRIDPVSLQPVSVSTQ